MAVVFDHRTGESTTTALDWTEDGDRLRTTAEGEPERRYRLERINADAFRLAGGELGLDTRLYRRVEPLAEGEIPAAWFVGTWEGRSGLEWLVLTLGADGRQTSRLGDGALDAGSWHAVPGQLVLADDGAAAIGYRAEVPDGGQLNLSGGNLGSTTLFLRRTAMPTPGDPLAGQFVGGDMTLLLERRAGGIAARGFLRGEPMAVEAELADDGTLSLRFPEGAGGVQQGTAYYNGLGLSDGYQNSWLEKQAERPLPLPDGLEGEWMYASWEASSSYAFLADGRYVATYTSSADGAAPLVTDGTFARDGNRLTLDPECAAPTDYRLALGGPQLMLGSAFSDGSDGTTYHFVPDSPATVAAMIAARDATWAAEDAAWEARLALAPATTGAPNTPTSEVPVDPSPETVFADATAFASSQVYLWQSDYSYVQMQGEPGLLYSVTTGQLILDRNLAARIDWTRGQYNDSVKIFLYPNGRMFSRIESYVGAQVRVDAVIPQITTAWGRYRVEGDLIVGDEEEIELLHGRRRIRSAELCLDNVAWAAEGFNAP
ncbi:MAG: hypothetical protein ACFCVH_09610, partial [Alphaproteobacteria bacterium]